MPKYQVKLLLAAGAAGLAAASAYYYIYLREQQKKREDADEGIGDEDSIISDSEDPAILQNLTTPVTIAPKDSDSTEFSFKPEEKVGNGKDAVKNHDTLQTLETQKKSVAEAVVKVAENANESETSDDANEVTKRVLILGLDQSGKTSLIETLTKRIDRDDNYKPTNGFNVAQARCDGFLLNFVEVGGSETTRQYWFNFVAGTDLLVYVIDGHDKERFEEAKDALAEILKEKSLAEVPCLLLSNKQDKSGAVPGEKVIAESDMSKLSLNRNLKLTILDSVCVPVEDTTIEYSDTLMAVILNLLE